MRAIEFAGSPVAKRHKTNFTRKKIRCRGKRRVSKSAQCCARVSVNANCKSDAGTLRFAHPMLAKTM
jgi:hypothetical protein